MLHICRFHICRLNQPQIKGKKKKKPESSIKQNLRWLRSTNFLHDIYIVFTTIYIAFTLCCCCC